MKFRIPKGIRSRVIRPIPLGLVIAVFAAGLLLFDLLSHVSYGQPEEPHSLKFATSQEILNHALYAPLKILGILILKLTENDVYTRLASAAAAMTAAVLLYLMLRKWYTARVSVLTMVMFCTSSWFLQQGRLTNLEVMQLSVVPGLLLISLWLVSKKHGSKMPFAAVLLGLLLYVPGAWLLALGAFIIFRGYIKDKVNGLPKSIKLSSAALLIVALMPLLYSFTRGQRQIINWLGWDTGQSYAAGSIAGDILAIPKELFVSGPNNPAFWLNGTPVLDIFSAAMLVLGIYAFYAGYYPTRERIIYGALAICLILIGLGGMAGLSLILPVIYIVIANGLAYMLQSWFTVFPRNPFARSLGIAALCIVIGLSSFYQLRRHYVAWPSSTQTQSALTTNR